MEYNVGDKLLCKKGYMSSYHNIINKEQIYVICEVFKNAVLICGNEKRFWWFYYNIQKFQPLLQDYFYTKEELRRLKLEKIDGI